MYKVQQVDINMYINKIFQVRKVKQMFAGHISLDFGIVHSIHICRICSIHCSSNAMHKLFPRHISNSYTVLGSPLEGKFYLEAVGTTFHLQHDKTHTV